MTRSTIAPALLLLAASSAMAAAPAQAAELEAYRWKARPVLVFAPRHGDRQAIAQLERLKGAASELADRDMPVLVVTGRDVADLAGAGAGADPAARPDGAQLRQAYGVADDAFAVVLVGKDGGQKLKSDEPVEASRLLGLVDAMPMRQDEQSTGSTK